MLLLLPITKFRALLSLKERVCSVCERFTMECKTEFEVVPASSHVREDSSKESGNLIAAAVAFLGWAFIERRLPRPSWSTGKLDCVLEESAKWCETFGGIGGCHVSATNIRDVFHDMCSVNQKRRYRLCFEEVDHTRFVKACVLKEYSTCERLAVVAAMEALMGAATPTYVIVMVGPVTFAIVVSVAQQVLFNPSGCDASSGLPSNTAAVAVVCRTSPLAILSQHLTASCKEYAKDGGHCLFIRVTLTQINLKTWRRLTMKRKEATMQAPLVGIR